MLTLSPNWREGMQQVANAIDDAFAEMVTVVPIADRKPNYSSTNLPEKAFDLPAVFSWRSVDTLKASRQGTIAGIIQTRTPLFTFSRHKLQHAFVLGDQITRHCDGSTFEITTIEPDGVSKVTVHVVEIGRSGQ